MHSTVVLMFYNFTCSHIILDSSYYLIINSEPLKWIAASNRWRMMASVLQTTRRGKDKTQRGKDETQRGKDETQRGKDENALLSSGTVQQPCQSDVHSKYTCKAVTRSGRSRCVPEAARCLFYSLSSA